MKGSWRTTTTGILTLVVVVCGAAKALLDGDPTTNPDWAALSAAATAAWGLIHARDNSVSSEDAGAK